MKINKLSNLLLIIMFFKILFYKIKIRFKLQLYKEPNNKASNVNRSISSIRSFN